MLQPTDLGHIDFQEGALLLVDKPSGWTSFDVVNLLRYRISKTRNLRKPKVGHAGTLDPLATGLLIICTGKWTKRIEEFMGLPKTYEGTLVLGASTPSYDMETEPDGIFPWQHITPVLLEEVRQQFIGDLLQAPPVFSAIKVDGQPLYKKARRGQEVEVPPRPVHIYHLTFTRIALPEVDFEVRCSKGTYIRSLAHDIGRALGSGAYLKALRRTEIGDFHIRDAWGLEALIEALEK